MRSGSRVAEGSSISAESEVSLRAEVAGRAVGDRADLEGAAVDGGAARIRVVAGEDKRAGPIVGEISGSGDDPGESGLEAGIQIQPR